MFRTSTIPRARRRAALASAIVAVAALIVQIASVEPAQAVLTRTGAGHIVSYQPTVAGAARARGFARSALVPGGASTYKPCAAAAACLTYYGGPVMRTTTLTPIFWNPTGLSLAYPAGYEAEIEQFLASVAAGSGVETNFFSVLTQYYEEVGGEKRHVSYAVATGSAQTDTDALPSGAGEKCTSPFSVSRPCVTDKGVRTELEAFIKGKGLATGIGHEYIVFFPPGIDSCFDAGGNEDKNCSGTGYCGYHSALQAATAQEVEFTNEPDNADPQYGGACTPAANLKAGYTTINTTSHEISESVTDPEVGAPELSWYDENKAATLAGTIEYGEIGDMCAWTFKQGDTALGVYNGEGFDTSASSNQTINGHPYLLQDEWDNAHSTCSLSQEAASTKAVFSDSAPSAKLTGEAISFDGGNSHAPVSIKTYEWSWGDGSHTSTVSALAEHTYASTEGVPTKSFTVTLTVIDENGNTDTTTKKVEVVDRKPTAAFSSPAGLVAGAAAQFEGAASSDPDGKVLAYGWSFGDGANATGAAPSHTYAIPGGYTVTLTVTDDAGNTASVSHPVTVADAPPVASFGVSTATPTAGQPVSFDASASKDIDGSAVTDAWSFGDGGSATGVQSAHVYAAAGSYTVKLTVTDSAGLSASAEGAVSVAAPPNPIQTSLSQIQAPSNAAQTPLSQIQAQSSGIRIAGLKQNKKQGMVTLVVLVPGPGILSARDASSAHGSDLFTVLTRAVASLRHVKKGNKTPILVKPFSRAVAQAGTVALPIAPTAAALADLSRNPSLAVKLLIAFTPTGGATGTTMKTVDLVKQPPSKRKAK